jgi:hypothetical protein
MDVCALTWYRLWLARMCFSLEDEHEPSMGQPTDIQAQVCVPGLQYGCWNVTVSPACSGRTSGTYERKNLSLEP